MHNYAFNPTFGLKSFLSPRSCALLLDRFLLNLRSASLLATGTPAGLPVDGLFGLLRRGAGAAESEDERSKRLLHYASQAWNLNFFLSSLTDSKTTPPQGFLNRINRDFGSFARFKLLFEAEAESLLGSGWCWLLHDQSTDRLLIVATPNGQSPLIHRQGSAVAGVQVSPVLGVDLWEAAYVLDYGIERGKYVRAWWQAINWHRVSVLL